jgi:surface polysaccharide O-acyltransferase-like enzyme
MSTGYVLLNRDGVHNNYSWNKIKKILHVVFLWSLLISISYLFWRVIKNELNLQVLIVLPKTFFGGLIQRGYLWHFWYMGALIIIYAIYPLLMRYRKRLTLIWIISAFVGVLIQITSYIVGIPVQRYIIQTFRLWSWIQYFVLGGLIGSHNNKEKVSIWKRAVVCILMNLSIVVYQNVMGKTFLHNSYAEYFYDSALTIIWLISIFYFILGLTLDTNVKSLIQNIAPITMGVYLTHPLVMRVVQHFVFVDSLGMSFVYFFAVLIISSICVFAMRKIPFVKRLVEL